MSESFGIVMPRRTLITDLGWSGPAGGATSNSFNPSDKSTNGVLSNANLTFKNNNGSDARIGVRSIGGRNSALGGKFYFEKHENTILSTASAFGITLVSTLFSNFVFNGASVGGVGFTLDGASYLNGNINGVIWDGGSDGNEWSAFAFDFDNMRAWAYAGFTARWNASATADPANPATFAEGMDISALAGTYYATVQLLTDQSQITAGFGPTFHFTPPTNFLAW